MGQATSLWYEMVTDKDLSAYSHHCCASVLNVHTSIAYLPKGLRGLSTCLVCVLTLCVYRYTTAAQVCVLVEWEGTILYRSLYPLFAEGCGHVVHT